jgi:hypothetical protein
MIDVIEIRTRRVFINSLLIAIADPLYFFAKPIRQDLYQKNITILALKSAKGFRDVLHFETKGNLLLTPQKIYIIRSKI